MTCQKDINPCVHPQWLGSDGPYCSTDCFPQNFESDDIHIGPTPLSQYEICKQCGAEQRIGWSVRNDLWAEIESATGHKLLCLNCFFAWMDDHDTAVRLDDFMFLGILDRPGSFVVDRKARENEQRGAGPTCRIQVDFVDAGYTTKIVINANGEVEFPQQVLDIEDIKLIHDVANAIRVNKKWRPDKPKPIPLTPPPPFPDEPSSDGPLTVLR